MADAQPPEFVPGVTSRMPDSPVTERIPDGPVTERVPESPVTERMGDGAVTSRFQDDPVDGERLARATARFGDEPGPQAAAAPAIRGFAPLLLEPGDMVEDRYRIEAGPLGQATGEAEVYQCYDLVTEETLALKLYRDRVSPKQSVLEALVGMRHPDIVNLRAFGSWMARFYEVMDYCDGGALADYMPFNETDLTKFTEQIIMGLQYLHDIGVIHRDIKPSNLFFRSEVERDLVIGDFGVSSILDIEEKVRRTSTGAFFTLDYAAPELLDGKEVSPKTDYYALGVTLLHLMTGTSPFVGMEKNAILGSHFRGNVPRPESISEEFNQLINGLLRVDPVTRWGFRQVLSWLRKEPVLNDDGMVDREDVYAGKRVPYRSLPEITTPIEMAARLGDFDAARDMQRGFVSQWVMFFDTDLGRRVAKVEETHSRRPELGVFALRYLLDPMQPLMVGERKIRSVEELVRMLADHRTTLQDDLARLLYGECLEMWISSLRTDARTRDLVQRIAGIRKHLEKPELALFALMYTLDPKQPLVLAGNTRVKAPEEFDQVLTMRLDLSGRIAFLLYGGFITEWLRASFPGRAEDIRFIAAIPHDFSSDRELGVFAMRCRFCPSTPFRLGTERPTDPKQVVQLIDRDPVYREAALRAIANNWLRTWLLATGRLSDPAGFDRAVGSNDLNINRKLEAILHFMDPTLPWPQPMADADRLDGGIVSAEGTGKVSVMIFNAARGHLAGTITLARTGRGFDMPSTNLDGEPVEVTVRLSGRGLPPGSTQNTSILVNTNGGKLEIPVSFRVSVPTGRIILRALRAGTVAAIIMAGYRLAIQAFYPEYVADPMEFVTLEHVTAYANRWAIVPLSLTFFSMVGGAIYLAYRMFLLRITQEMPQNAPPPLPRDTGGGGIGGGPLMGGPVTPPIPPDVMASRNRKRRYL